MYRNGIGVIAFTFFTLAVVGVASPSTAAAQRVGGFGLLGAGGDLQLSADGRFLDGSNRTALDPTGGFGVFGDIPLHRFVMVGGRFETRWSTPYQTDGFWLFDVSVLGKFRYALEIGDVTFEPYAALPIGVTLGRLWDFNTLEDDRTTWPGWNIGVLAGLNVILGHIGIMFELGWRHHQVFDTIESTNIGVDAAMHQFEMSLGVMYVFE